MAFMQTPASLPKCSLSMTSATAALGLAILTAVVGFAPVNCQAQEGPDYRVLPIEFNSDKEQQMMRAYQRDRVHASLGARLEELDLALDSVDAMAAYQQKRREYLASVFGPLPSRGPLNAQITHRLPRDGYSIENVLFESLPGFYVTANFYRPAGEGPFPAVLLPCGHSVNGKAYASYQKASILLAQHGFVVLCFDPLGQGERRQLIGDQPHALGRPRSEHNPIGVAPILLGRSLAAMMVWDGMRGIDYLCSRSEVDANRIGCTGISGGGNLTSYLMAFDERIVAAAPGCFMTTHRRKNESPGPGDAEQNLHAQIRDGFDHPDFILTRAPKPTLILAATHDYVPIEGTWESFRQAKRVYTVFGHPERVALLETNDKHGFSKRMREGVVRFMLRWLQGRHMEVFEDDDVPILSDEQLQVTPHGQVLWLANARSVFDLYTETERDLATQRPPLTAKVVRDSTGIRPLAQLPAPKVENVPAEHDNQAAIPSKLIIRPEPGIVLPALHWADGERHPILIAPGDGMNSVVEQAQEWNTKGHPVLIVEVRDTGETSTRNWRFPGADSFIGHMLGRSWVTMRTEDLLISARWLAEGSTSKHVSIHATGEIAPAAWHAGYLEPDLITDVQTTDGLSSWRELMTSRDAYDHIHQAVYGALRSYDLPDLQRK